MGRVIEKEVGKVSWCLIKREIAMGMALGYKDSDLAAGDVISVGRAIV